MATGTAMNDDKRPVLTAQPTRSNRVQYVCLLVVFQTIFLYGAKRTLDRYSRDATIENLFILAVVIVACFAMLYFMARPVAKRVEFFENHLVEHSFWVFSRTRTYQEISRLEVAYVWAVRQVFIIRFSDGGKIAVFNDEIHFDGLAEWMDQRGVSGVEEVKKNIFRDEYLDRFHNRK